MTEQPETTQPDQHAKVYDFPAPDNQTETDGTGQDQADRTAEADQTQAGQDQTSADNETEGDGSGAVLVDSAESQRSGLLDRVRSAEHHQIIPGWLKSRQEFTDTTRWVAKHYAHAGAYHAVRAPLYGLKLGVRAPHGGLRVLAGARRWAADAEGQPVREAAVRTNDPERYLKLSRQRDARVRSRSIIVAAGAVAVPFAAITAWTLVPPLALWPAVAVLAGLLGLLGGQADRPLIGRAVVGTEVSKLTSDLVIRALSSLGIAEISKAVAKGQGISFPSPIVRDGPGWRADIDLPFGVTVTDIMDRRDRVASGLRRPVGCVWPEPASDQHAGRLVLWVGDLPMNQAKQPAWPLAKQGQADVFAPVPFGHDQRGRRVDLTLMFNSVLIGAMPRQGKTFALRVLVLALALDPRVQLRAFELKGTGDLSATEKIAHHYASGADDPAVEAAMDSLREMEKELPRRSRTIANLPKTMCPENKVTPQLASRKDLGLEPVALVIDECQELFTHPEHGQEAARLAERIIKLGPAMGVMLLLATQRPDSKSLPTGVSANAGIRFCLRVMGQTENDMVLGTSMYKNGTRATTFTAKDKGIGYLVGVSDDPQIARSAYIDADKADAITDRARKLRETAGTLSGHAIGQDTTAESTHDTLLEDILTVTGPEATGADRWNDTITAKLAAHDPGKYGQWTGEQLTAALKPHGIRTGQVWGTDDDSQGRNRRGINPTDIHDALTERNQKKVTV